jgi:Tol biopolymer transport system component
VLPETADYYGPMLSPDGSKLAVAIENNGLTDIWIVDLAHHTKTRITFGPQYRGARVWWPDGETIVFNYGPSGTMDSLYRQNADGTGTKEKLLETPGILVTPFSVSPDGRYIAYVRLDPKSKTNQDMAIESVTTRRRQPDASSGSTARRILDGMTSSGVS